MIMSQRTLLEVQFPIGPLSLESYIERDSKGSKALSSLGKWWGSKPLVLTRAIILAAVFPSSENPERWPDDLEIFLKCMCLDDAGMWRRKTASLPPDLCLTLASDEERKALFDEDGKWKRRSLDRKMKEALEKRVFYTLGHTVQREYCCRVEEIDGPSPESWEEINTYLHTTATSLPELVQQLAVRIFGSRLKVGDAFSGLGSIPFEASELGCDVYASDLNPVACLLTWGALNIVGGSDEFRKKVHAEQKRVYDEVDAWICENGLEYGEEGWRAEAYLYCVEMAVPEWDGWHIPICPSWVIAPKNRTWVELVPIEADKRFGFRVVHGGDGWSHAEKGTKQGQNVVCPQSLWELFKRDGRHLNTPHTIPYNQLIKNAGGLRHWEKHDFIPRPDDLLKEQNYCIRWRLPDLKNLLAEEQLLRSTRKNDSRLREITAIFLGLRTFFKDRDWMTLDDLRLHDWSRETDEITILESEITQVREQKGSADALKLLRSELKVRKDARHEREIAMLHLSALVPRLIYREPHIYDLEVESKVVKMLDEVFDNWQSAGWIPGWRIEPGEKTDEPIRNRGWTYWNDLFTPRQLLIAGEFSRRITSCETEVRAALVLNLGRMLDTNARLCRWLGTQGGGIGGTKTVFYNQALNTFFNYAGRGWIGLESQLQSKHKDFSKARSRRCSSHESQTFGRHLSPPCLRLHHGIP